MKRENVIDMSSYFLHLQAAETSKSRSDRFKKAAHYTVGLLETAATVGITLGFCVCTFLFFVVL